MVIIAYKEPNSVLEILSEITQKGTNNDIKNVWPYDEKKLNKNPKFNKRLLLPTNRNQSFIPNTIYFFRQFAQSRISGRIFKRSNGID